MLLAWPLVALWLFRRLGVERGLIWTILGGYLLLPPLVAVNFPVVPDLDKDSIPALAALVIGLALTGKGLSVLPENPLGKLLIAIFVLSPFATVLTNPEPVPRGPVLINGVSIYDSVAAVANQGLALLPFFLARRYLAEAASQRQLLVALVVAGLLYSVPMLIEVRLSPQLNVWVYGFFQHDFFQTIRFGGYRPVVFLPHGLWVAFFTLTCLLAAAALWRETAAEARLRLTGIALYLALMLVICKSAGPMVYAAAMLPLILLAPRRLQVALAAAIAAVVILYPLLRGLHLIPTDAILATAERLNPERAASLAFRITNEEALLDHANRKPWFGWGGYGRNLLYDPQTGSGVSIADGAWIITLGIYGWLGYLAQFGLLVLPLLLLAVEAWKKPPEGIAAPVAALALMLAANLLDLLPNATLEPLTWLMAGALLGQAEILRQERRVMAGIRGIRHRPAVRSVLR